METFLALAGCFSLGWSLLEIIRVYCLCGCDIDDAQQIGTLRDTTRDIQEEGENYWYVIHVYRCKKCRRYFNSHGLESDYYRSRKASV